MKWVSELYYNYSKYAKMLAVYLAIAGPGIIVMVADNDAGGITTYAATGAKYGFALIWFLILLGPIAYFVQEMTVRLGAVTKKGHAEAIFDAFGPFWGWFSLADLTITNWLTVITEFIGMTAALSIFGISPIYTVIGVTLLMTFMVLQGKYWTWEKITFVFVALNLIYIPAAILVHPSLHDVIYKGIIPTIPAGSLGLLFFFIMANIGTTIAPWMIFFQQSSVVDKNMSEKDIIWGKADTAVGSILTVVVAVFVILVAGTLLYGQNIQSAAQAAIAIMPINYWVGVMFAIGLFDAGLLGAVAITLSSSWAFGEVFGWAHSLNQNVREAPWFYVTYFLGILSAGAVVLIPNAPLVLITLFVQVIATTILPATMVFLIILLNREEIMGKYKNTKTQNIINTAIVLMLIIMSTLYAVSVIFPNLFGGLI